MSHDPYASPQAEPSHPNPHRHPSAATFDDVVARFKPLVGCSGMIGVWAIVALSGLPSQLLNVVAQKYILTDMVVGFGLIALIYPITLIVMTLHFTSFKAVDAADAAGGEITFGEATGHLFSRFLPTLLTTLLYGIACLVGGLFCFLPGLFAAVLFCLAPFITAAYGDSPIDAMRLSYEWVSRHAALIAIVICVGVLYAFVLGIIGLILMAVSGVAFGQMGATAGYGLTVVTWLISSFAGYFVWLFSGATFVTIARAEETTMGLGLRDAPQGDVYGEPRGSADKSSTPAPPYDAGNPDAW